MRDTLRNMNVQDFWAELKRRRVVRVAVAYAAAVFVALQVADLTFDPLGLPASAYRLLVVIALAGFPVAVALAWAFDVTPEGVKKEERPAGGETRSMGRVVIGAAVALVVVVGGWQLRGGADPVGADSIDNELIAVVPFRVSTSDERVAILREGIIDMLAPIFAGAPRIVDTGAMISAWREYAETDGAELSEARAVELARRLGAGRVLLGSIVGGADGFAVNARLLGVPGGHVIGDAAVEGSADRLRETIGQLARQVLSMEAGVDAGQIDYLDEVPLPALEAYLAGRRAYRRSAYVEARTAFARALDSDSTFALAALGAWEAVEMGVDFDRWDLGARARRLLLQNLDRLPARDRTYADLYLRSLDARSAAEAVRFRQDMVRRLPDKAEAWYLYGDAMLHSMWRVRQSDWLERATEAFERAAELDPGLEIVDQHIMFAGAFSRDTAAIRVWAQPVAEGAGASETKGLARAVMAYAVGSPEQAAWIDQNLEGLSFTEVQMIPLIVGWPGVRIPAAVMERGLERMELSAIAEADHRQALLARYSFLRDAGRSDEADEALRRLEAAYGPRPDAWVGAALYWDGLREPAEAAVRTLTQQVEGESGPLLWSGLAQQACMLELWRLREGDTSRTDVIVGRLRAGSDDADPAHGRNALCALTLEALAAERNGSADADRLLDELVTALDAGPGSVLNWTSLEAAWMLERRGDLEAAARLAGYRSGTDSFPFASSTVNRESGRLADAAGNTDVAKQAYEVFLQMRTSPDERFTDRDAPIRARFAELEARAQGGR